jgi:transcriptional regulator with XRE-family HTH domain
MPYYSDSHIPPIGTQLRDGRAVLRVTRAQVAKDAGISENTLARYENAGLSDKGIYPPADKLVMLCNLLDLEYHEALVGCRTAEAHEKLEASSIPSAQEGGTFENDIGSVYLISRFKRLLTDNFVLRDFIRAAILEVPQAGSPEEQTVELLKSEAQAVFRRQDEFQADLVRHGVAFPYSFGDENFSFLVHNLDADEPAYAHARMIPSASGAKVNELEAAIDSAKKALGKSEAILEALQAEK